METGALLNMARWAESSTCVVCESLEVEYSCLNMGDMSVSAFYSRPR